MLMPYGIGACALVGGGGGSSLSHTPAPSILWLCSGGTCSRRGGGGTGAFAVSGVNEGIPGGISGPLQVVVDELAPVAKGVRLSKCAGGALISLSFLSLFAFISAIRFCKATISVGYLDGVVARFVRILLRRVSQASFILESLEFLSCSSSNSCSMLVN